MLTYYDGDRKENYISLKLGTYTFFPQYFIFYFIDIFFTTNFHQFEKDNADPKSNT